MCKSSVLSYSFAAFVLGFFLDISNHKASIRGGPGSSRSSYTFAKTPSGRIVPVSIKTNALKRSERVRTLCDVAKAHFIRNTHVDAFTSPALMIIKTMFTEAVKRADRVVAS